VALKLTFIPWFMDIDPQAHTHPSIHIEFVSSIHIEFVWLMDLYSYAHDYMVKSDQPKPLFTNPFDSCLVSCISEVWFAFFVFSLFIYLMCYHLLLPLVNHRVSPPLLSCSHLPPFTTLYPPLLPLLPARRPPTVLRIPSPALLPPRG
jgi:hypothetical protein